MHAYIDHRFDLLPCGVIAPETAVLMIVPAEYPWAQPPA